MMFYLHSFFYFLIIQISLYFQRLFFFKALKMKKIKLFTMDANPKVNISYMKVKDETLKLFTR